MRKTSSYPARLTEEDERINDGINDADVRDPEFEETGATPPMPPCRTSSEEVVEASERRRRLDSFDMVAKIRKKVLRLLCLEFHGGGDARPGSASHRVGLAKSCARILFLSESRRIYFGNDRAFCSQTCRLEWDDNRPSATSSAFDGADASDNSQTLLSSFLRLVLSRRYLRRRVALSSCACLAVFLFSLITFGKRRYLCLPTSCPHRA